MSAVSVVESGYFPHFDVPRHNPCAQCGKPIAMPEWIEENRRSVAFLWHCWACDYKFESVAVFRAEEVTSAALAA